METRYDQLDTQRVDIGTTTIYVGYTQRMATPDDAAHAWTVKRVTLDASGNPTKIEWAPENSVWDDRASLTYT